MNTFFTREQRFSGPAMPLLNSGNWNPALHPRDSHGEFRYNGGRHHHAKSVKASGASALHNALTRLTIDRTYNNKQKGKANRHGIYITHYGPSPRVGGWDHPGDSQTDAGQGNHNNKLNSLSLAISGDIVASAGLKPGDQVYINGEYIGNYDDSPDKNENGRVDIYDHDNSVGTNWSGMVWGGVLTNHPRRKKRLINEKIIFCMDAGFASHAFGGKWIRFTEVWSEGVDITG